MATVEIARGRPHDSKAAQTAILNAAEAAFAQSGFAGARIDSIAAAAGYNKSLIFQYFEDKLGLYTAVLRRAEEQISEMQAQFFAILASNPHITSDPYAFRWFIERAIGTAFDYLVAHPTLLHLYAWEEAEGWATMAQIAPQSDVGDSERLTTVLEKAQKAGLLRPDISPHLVLNLIIDICRTYISSLPRLQMIEKGDDFSRPNALDRARGQIVAFVLHGMVVDVRSGART